MSETEKETGTEKESIVITVERRELRGSKVKSLRREGKIPAIIYGGGKESTAITVDHHVVKELLRKQGGENTIFLLKLAGTKQERRAMIRDIQLHPITREFLHIDFIRVTRGQKLNVTVPIELVGDSVGARHGGLVDFQSRELQVEILPREMIDKLVVDITELDLGEHIRVKDLESMLPASGRFLDDSQRIVATIESPRGRLDEDEEEQELLVAEQAEPEVLRGRKDEESAS